MGLTGGGIERKRLVANYSKYEISEISTLNIHPYHVNNLRVYDLSNDSALSCDVFQHLVEGLSFDLLSFEFSTCIIEVEEHAALIEFFDK